jgi:hypothetical protein
MLLPEPNVNKPIDRPLTQEGQLPAEELVGPLTRVPVLVGYLPFILPEENVPLSINIRPRSFGSLQTSEAPSPYIKEETEAQKTIELTRQVNDNDDQIPPSPHNVSQKEMGVLAPATPNYDSQDFRENEQMMSIYNDVVMGKNGFIQTLPPLILSNTTSMFKHIKRNGYHTHIWSTLIKP